MTDLGQRRAAQLVAVVTLVLFGLTLVGSLAMTLLDAQTLRARLPVLTLLELSYALIYALNRTRHAQIAAFLLCLGPVWSDLTVGLSTPDDPIWYAFLPCGTLLASILLPFRGALLLGALGVAATAIVVTVNSALLGAARGLLILGFEVLFSAIVLATARFRIWVEAGRREELRELERQLADKQRMETVGRLAAGVAHDFNNFLTVIEGTVELFKRGSPAADFKDIEGAADRAHALTEQLLAFARQKSRSPTLLLVDEVIRGLTSILTRLAGHGVTFDMQLSASWQVEVDRVQLEQILLNLTANARDAMPRGGVIELATQDETRAPRDMPGSMAREFVLITFSDSGSGMDADTVAHAFEPFFSTKPANKGSGLGLATVRSIVVQSGGEIDVLSEPGKGTTFHIWLPRGQLVAKPSTDVAAPLHSATPVA